MNALLAALILTQSPTVTFESRAERLSRLLPALSKAAGVKLEANGTIEDEVLWVKAHKLDRQVFLDSLAKVTLGKWTSKDGKAILTADSEARRQGEKRWLDAMVGVLNRSVQTFRNRTIGNPFDEASARKLSLEFSNPPKAQGANRPVFDSMIAAYGPYYRAPAGRFAARILPLVDWKAVAMQPYGERVTFSSSPNRLQLPFVENVAEALAKYDAEQKIWIEHARVIPDSQDKAVATARDQRGATEVLVSVRNWRRNGSQVDVVIRDANGRLQNLGNAIRLGEEMLEELYPPVDPAKRVPLVLSPESKQLVDYLRNRQRDPSISLPAHLAEILFNPSRHEIGATVASDILAAIFKERSNVVARVPDWFAIRPLAVPVNITRAYAESLVKEHLLEEAHEGVSLVLPRPLSYADQVRLPRDVWQKVADESRTTGSIRLETASELALGAKDQEWFDAAMFAARVLQKAGVEQELGFLELKLYGSLSSEQRMLLHSGGALSSSQMNPIQQAILLRMLVQGAFRNSSLAGSFQDGNYWAAVPTEFFPHGLPADLNLVGISETLPAIFKPGGTTSRTQLPVMRQTPWTIASGLHNRARQTPDPTTEAFFGPGTKFFLGKGKRLRLQVNVHPGLQVWTRLDDSVPDISRLVDYKDFPKPLKDAVEAEMAKLRGAMPLDPPEQKTPPP